MWYILHDKITFHNFDLLSDSEPWQMSIFSRTPPWHSLSTLWFVPQQEASRRCWVCEYILNLRFGGKACVEIGLRFKGEEGENEQNKAEILYCWWCSDNNLYFDLSWVAWSSRNRTRSSQGAQEVKKQVKEVVSNLYPSFSFYPLFHGAATFIVDISVKVKCFSWRLPAQYPWFTRRGREAKRTISSWRSVVFPMKNLKKSW